MLPHAPVAAGLHSLAASNLAEAPPDEDAFVCGDDEVAKRLALEGMTAVIVNVNKRYKAHAGLRLTGIS